MGVEQGKRRKSVLKAVAAVILSAVIGMLNIPGMSMVSTVHAEEGKSIACLGTGRIGNPIEPDNIDNEWSGSYVYYGKYGGKPMKYRVLSKKTTDFGGTTMLLDCDSILEQQRFDVYSNHWGSSELHGWLNGNHFLNNTDVFSTAEKEAIFESNVGNRKYKSFVDGRVKQQNWFVEFSPLSNDKIFLLDVEDTLNKSYGYYPDDGWTKNDNGGWNWHIVKNHIKNYGATGSVWWLRSPYFFNDFIIGCVDYYGNVYNTYGVSDTYVGVSPAFNVNLPSVLFSSEISNEYGSYKLTVLDSKMETKVGSAGVSRSGSTITVPYTITGDNKGEATQVSVLLTDSGYTPGTAATSGYTYLKLNTVGDFSTSGTGTFTLPDTYANKKLGTDYHMYILAEDVNEGEETDYASAPVEVHNHSFTYTASGASITATCTTGCTSGYDTKGFTLTLDAPTSLNYDGNAKVATFSGYPGTSPDNLANLAAEPTTIIYYASTGAGSITPRDNELSGAPSNAGNYVAQITWGGKTASVAFTITKADPISNVPAGLTATYGQTLADLTLINPTGNTAGTWTWVDNTASVGDVGEHIFKANFTPTDTTNYNSKENVDVTVNVGKANSTATKASAAKELADAKAAAQTSLKAAEAYAGNATVKAAIDALNAAIKEGNTAKIKTATTALNNAVKNASAPKATKVKIKTKSKTFKASTLQKKARTFKIKYKKTKGSGKAVFTKVSGSKKLTVSKAGKVKIKKGTKKGTYKIKVKVTVAANKTFKAGTATRTIKVKIK